MDNFRRDIKAIMDGNPINDKIYVVIEFKREDKKKYLYLFKKNKYMSSFSNGSLIEMNGDTNIKHDYIISKYDLTRFYDIYQGVAVKITFKPSGCVFSDDDSD